MAEVIVVMVILSVLAAYMVPSYHKYIEKARMETYIAEAKMVEDALLTYILEEYAAGTLNRNNVRNDLMKPEFGSPEHALTEMIDGNFTPGSRMSYLSMSFESGEYRGMVYEIEGYSVEFTPGKAVSVTKK